MTKQYHWEKSQAPTDLPCPLPLMQVCPTGGHRLEPDGLRGQTSPRADTVGRPVPERNDHAGWEAGYLDWRPCSLS